MPRRGQLRIIGGRWRGRRLPFAAFAGVRPTPDRVRETVFNWLQGRLEGSRCLDLFAGSGAFGFEALSRGADSVVMVEQDLRVVQTLQRNAEMLEAENLEVAWSDAADYLRRTRGAPFDIVFLDPPYRDGRLNQWARQLADSRLLSHPAWIYLEAAAGLAPELPPGWELLRSKQAGQVGYHLARAA
ncbi:MAG TPA: 16S rRNA (guanine(966)-N(2))-methyltransferase RsmD [Gammaproteobacteria bacterium]|nr:16S rRNA (guanine(966)-N(2))-methyltransferase RsmD [Gammaproteobacteria bacterium]